MRGRGSGYEREIELLGVGVRLQGVDWGYIKWRGVGVKGIVSIGFMKPKSFSSIWHKW